MTSSLKKLLLLSLIGGLSPLSQAVEGESELVKKVRANQQWQLQSNQCPADISPQRVSRDNATNIDAGLPKTIAYHYKKCAVNAKAGACYNLALGLQKLDYAAEAETAFQQACRLGYASGCTNRAAGMLNHERQQEQVNLQKMQCIARSFAKTCTWKDPWGCSMYSQSLLFGEGVKQDTKKALAVLKDSCLYGEDHPACEAAYGIRGYINRMEATNK